jgi:hypothetical protein
MTFYALKVFTTDGYFKEEFTDKEDLKQFYYSELERCNKKPLIYLNGTKQITIDELE